VNPSLPRITCLFLILSPVLGTTASADTLFLNDGTELSGRLVSERDDAYVMEVQVGRGIWDEVTVPREDVLRLERVQPESRELEELEKLVPIPDLLTAEEYAARIARIRKFTDENEDVARAGEILDLHLAEARIIEDGGVKLDGRLVPGSERIANLYEINSRIAAAEVQRLAQSSNLLGALRAFTTFEADYNGSGAWRALVPLIQQVISSHQSGVREMLNDFDARHARQEAGLSRMGFEQRQAATRAIAERDAALNARFDQERNIRGHWPSISPDHRPALEATVRMAEQELRRLSNAASQPLREPVPAQVWRNAIAAIQSGDATATRNAIQSVRNARMPERYINKINQLAEEAAARAEEEKQRLEEEARRLAEEAEARDAEPQQAE